MSKKKGKTYVIAPKQKEQVQVIDMNDVNRKKAYHPVPFRTGRHLTEKDRPRKKNWKREYVQ